MLSIPEKYKKSANIPKKAFMDTVSLPPAGKERFRKSIELIQLKYQIEGFDIPNLVNDDYNCQVIMFLRVTLSDLKQVNFVNSIIQSNINALCVVEYTDGVEVQYSFADKRLNKQNKKEVVIENEYVTNKLPLEFQNDKKTLFNLYIDYETILNRYNKHAYYVEMMTKAFLVDNQGLFKGEDTLLDNKKLWYDEERTKLLFPVLKQLKATKLSLSKAKTISEKGKINAQIKLLIKELEDLQ